MLLPVPTSQLPRKGWRTQPQHPFSNQATSLFLNVVTLEAIPSKGALATKAAEASTTAGPKAGQSASPPTLPAAGDFLAAAHTRHYDNSPPTIGGGSSRVGPTTVAVAVPVVVPRVLDPAHDSDLSRSGSTSGASSPVGVEGEAAPSASAVSAFALTKATSANTAGGVGAAAATSSPPPDAASTAAAAMEWEPPEWLQRTTLLLGRGGVSSLRDTRVLVVGLGGVGSYVAEFLVRAGVGSLALVDGDVVDLTNKNRQLPALDSSIGQPKAHVMARRLRDINPDLNLVVRQEFLSPDGASQRLLDEVAAELELGVRAAAVAGTTAGTTATQAIAWTVSCRQLAVGNGIKTHSVGPDDAASDSSSIGNSGSTSPSPRCTSTSTSSHSSVRSSYGLVDGTQRAVQGPADCSGSTSSSDAAERCGIASTVVAASVAHDGGGSSGGAGGYGGGDAPPTPLHWVVDCIDSIAPKLALVAAASRRGARVVSSMGAGGRMDPLAVWVADISETYGDPFAAACRRGLRRQYGIHTGVTVVFSTEPCRRMSMALTSGAPYKRSYYGTISFLPALFGLHIAAHIVNATTEGPMLATEAEERKKLRQMRDAAKGGKASAGSAGRSHARGAALSASHVAFGAACNPAAQRKPKQRVPPPPPCPLGRTPPSCPSKQPQLLGDG